MWRWRWSRIRALIRDGIAYGVTLNVGSSAVVVIAAISTRTTLLTHLREGWVSD